MQIVRRDREKCAFVRCISQTTINLHLTSLIQKRPKQTSFQSCYSFVSGPILQYPHLEILSPLLWISTKANMEEKIYAWMGRNRDKAVKFGLEIKEMHRDFMVVKVGEYRIQVTVPSVFEDAACVGNVNSESDCVFVALPLEEDSDETLMNILETLNEKLERVTVTPDCVNKVFDNIIQVFDRHKCKNSKKQNLVVEQVAGQQLEESYLEESYLYKLVEDARMECELALSDGINSSNLNGILPWCSVKLNPGLEAVELQMDIKGIMSPNHVTIALGFCFDNPLKFHLTFGSGTFYAKEARSLDLSRSLDIFVKRSTTLTLQIGASVEKVVEGMEERLKDAIIKSFPANSLRPYGPYMLVPEFVKRFFHNHKIEPDGGDNIFVELLLALGDWLMMLRNWCVLCRKHLPPLSRLWYCDAELCLYRFEELGIGASVLHELQNSEVVDLELTLAAAATRSTTRDVFEPYPAFLLKKTEIRNRSGFFGGYIPGGNTVSSKAVKSSKCFSSEADFLANKNLDLLREIIDSFPSLSEMQNCSNEIELILKLGISWLQKDCINKTNLSQEDYTEKIWLPYKILRYVLFTNRSLLSLLTESHRLNVGESFYQFAVFYNSESEKNFEERRATEGSVFAFHGSYIGNWYSIIRNGLRCLSKTKYMSAGMVHGAGIYFSADMGYSWTYATCLPWKKDGITKVYYVMALCEIFLGKKFGTGPTGSNVLVVPCNKENNVVIRYLLVFEQKAAFSNSVLVTEGHMLSGTSLYRHYEQLRSQYVEKWRTDS